MRVTLKVTDEVSGIAEVPGKYMPDGATSYVHAAGHDEVAGLLRDLAPYGEWDAGIKAMRAKHPEFGYGSPVTKRRSASPRFQMINFLLGHPDVALDREGLDAVQRALCPERSWSGDVI